MLTGTVRTAEVTPPARSPFSFARSNRVDTARFGASPEPGASGHLSPEAKSGEPPHRAMMRDPSHHMEDADDAELDARMRARMRLAREGERRPMTERLIR